MKRRNIIIIFISLMPVFWVGCKESDRLDHIDYDAPAPAQVSDITHRNTPGGAVIYYKVPIDENLRYIRAEYEIQPGVVRENKSSRYQDSLVLEGFGDARMYEVKLYSVGKNEKTSEPLIVQVNPLMAPVKAVTLSLSNAFGGVTVNIVNPYKVNLAIELMGDTAQLGYQAIMYTFYTAAESGNFSFRGLDTVPRNYSVYVRDRWNNLSDTIFATLTPMFEEFIPKNAWQAVHLPTDSWQQIENSQNYVLPGMWDGIYNVPFGNNFISDGNSPLPQWVTWDMGITIVMSRIKIWGWWFAPFARYSIKKFELYGSTAPNPDGSWDGSWIPLGKFECVKPSSGTAITEEDIAFANEGFDFDLGKDDFAPDPFVPVRYLRLKTLETFDPPSPIGAVCISEINIWGTIVN